MTSQAPPPDRAPPARIILVDDHELARAGLRAMLAREADLAVVGEARTGREGVGLCQRLRPDLVLMDVRMPDMDGLAATRAIKETCPQTSVLVVTMHENPDYLLEALRVGAAGYVLKGATRRELMSAVRQVLGGDSLLHPALTAEALRRLAGQTNVQSRASMAPLSEREREVLQLVAQGRSNREIAEALMVSVSTIKTHVEHLLAKLGASDRTQAAVRAVELGLLSGTDR